MQQINFTGQLNRKATTFSVIEEAKAFVNGSSAKIKFSCLK